MQDFQLLIFIIVFIRKTTFRKVPCDSAVAGFHTSAKIPHAARIPVYVAARDVPSNLLLLTLLLPMMLLALYDAPVVSCAAIDPIVADVLTAVDVAKDAAGASVFAVAAVPTVVDVPSIL